MARPSGHQGTEEDDAPEQLGFPKGQGNEHRHKGAEGADADDIAQNHQQKTAQGHHEQDPVNLLGMDGQAEQGKLEKQRLFDLAPDRRRW